MFRIAESEKPKFVFLATFVLGYKFSGAWAKQRKRRQGMAGNATLLRSTGNCPGFSQYRSYTALLANQQAVVQMHHAVGAGGQLQVVRHHDQAGVLRAHLGEQQVEDDARCLAVEVAGRFVGEDA